MVVITIGAVLAGLAGTIGGVVAWFNNLPSWMKYVVFLAGMGIDVGIAGFTNTQGITGWLLSQAFAAFGFTVTITAPEVLLLALFIPLMAIFFKLYH